MSDDEFFEMLPTKVFDIGKMPEHVDLSRPATSAIEYIRQVRYEAMRCPSIVVAAELDPEKFVSKQNYKINADNGMEPAPPGFAPSQKWQAQQVSTFSQVRSNLISQKARARNQTSVKLPPISNKNKWCAFCLGFETQGNSKSKRTDDISCAVTPDAQLPLLTTLVRLIQPDIVKLLSHHVNWLNEFGFSHHQGRWIYSLLAFLEKPLTPDACHILRALARACTTLRSRLTDKNDNRLKALNLFICLVANYFDQKDIVDVKESSEESETDYEDTDENEDDLNCVP